jgi:ribosomal protein L35
MGDGSFKRKKSGKAHLNTGTPKRKLLELRQPAYTNTTQSNFVRKLIPYGN